MYVKIAVNIPADKTFTYAVPAHLERLTALGKRVTAPFGNRVATGYIIETSPEADVEKPREIIAISDDEPIFDREDLRFYQWVSRYYLHPFGKTLFEILPALSGAKKEKFISINSQDGGLSDPAVVLTARQEELVGFLRRNNGYPLASLRKQYKNAGYLVRCLHKKGVLRIEEREVARYPGVAEVPDKIDGPIELNEAQKKALQEILRGLAEKTFSPYLLHGVTGSGKTEVYIRAMETTIERGGGVIFLVPEIGLTPQLLSRIGGRFGNRSVAVIHSGIARAVRYDQWRRIIKGEVRIVVGARSAVFAPVRDLRLLIVDEEHDDSYKQDERLPYNSRDMAVVKAKLNAAAVVLGSATPSVQTYFNARDNKYRYLSLPERIQCRQMPSVEIVDMKLERGNSAEPPILSRLLKDAVAATLAAKKQALLFLNRRGFDIVVLCSDCGYLFKCPNCALTLKHHVSGGTLKCHCCDFSLKAFPLCPACGGAGIRSYGVGTEKLAEEVKRLFPQARVERMDSDTTARKGELERILGRLARHEVDILVGTQMITKGHDFPAITLVGVISADLSLNIPDFRAAESTFQILTQVGGRGGRGDAPGRVVIQTFNPEHYAVKRAREYDYQGFYEEEIELRKNLNYPPYARLVTLHLSSLRKEEGRAGVERIRKMAKGISQDRKMGRGLEILGPAESPVSKIKGRYRWQLLLKGKDIKAQCAAVEALRREAEEAGLEVKTDVDPMNFM